MSGAFGQRRKCHSFAAASQLPLAATWPQPMCCCPAALGPVCAATEDRHTCMAACPHVWPHA
eukprot:364358-Chlamydomonas_euryale.AAC.16